MGGLGVGGVTRMQLTQPNAVPHSQRPLTCRFFSLLHFRQGLSSNLHFRQFNGSKTRIADKVEMRNLWVLIELAAINCFHRGKELVQVTTVVT